MKKQDVYFSVDIEADGPIPGPYSMSSFGIAYVGSFDGRTFTRSTDLRAASLYYELQPISESFVPAAAAVSGLDRQTLIDSGTDPLKAMSYTADFVRSLAGNNRAVFAAYPLGFDWMWMYWYFLQYSTSGSPFGHSNHVDIKTLYMAKAGTTIGNSIKKQMPKKLMSKSAHTHNALDDAIEQGELFCNIMEWSKS